MRGKHEDIKVGDEVEWTSQSAGSRTTKRGVVLVEVRPGHAVREEMVLAGLRPAESRVKFGMGRRPARSYVVEVNGCLYWPRTSHLRKVNKPAQFTTKSPRQGQKRGRENA